MAIANRLFAVCRAAFTIFFRGVHGIRINEKYARSYYVCMTTQNIVTVTNINLPVLVGTCGKGSG